MPSASKRPRRVAQADNDEVEKEADPDMIDEKENLGNRSGRKSRRDGGKRKQRNGDDGDGSGSANEDEEMEQDEEDNDGDDDEQDNEEYDQGDEEDDGDNDNDERESFSSPSKRHKESSSKPISSPLRDRHLNPTGKPAEAGIIHSVHVENFMCHRKLTVNLCRNVNFIHGQNGSGKSAILAAIQVCLGAGARRTHRARNLKDLVRKESGADCSGARLRVTLLNRGADGFQPDVYGDTITVERSISLRSGGYNGYKLLNSAGKECSRSKKDLDAMLDQLNIQVENPVAVLDQEEAKKFLTGKPEDKYAFFTKATELERLDRVYANIADSILEQEDIKQRAKGALVGCIANAKRLKKEWEQFKELDKLEAECQELRAMYGWAYHSELGDNLNGVLRTAQKYNKSLEKRRAELVEAEKATNTTDDEELHYNKRLTELTEEANQAAQTKTQIEQELKRAMAPLKQKEREKEVLAREFTSAKKKLKMAQRRLEDARRQIIEQSGNIAEEERVRTRKIAQTETDLMRAKEKVDPLKEDIGKELKRYQDIKPVADQMKKTTQGTERQLHEVRRKVRDLQAEEGGGNKSLAVFGPKCKALYEAVQKAQKAKKFRGPVAGPVGMYAKVVDGKEKYAKIAELAIGPGQLDRFIVTNASDLEVMKKLRRDIGCGTRDCPLFQIHPRAANEKYNTPTPPEGVETITSVLSVDNNLAFNFLVDSARIDESALADSKEISERALLVTDGNGRESIRGKVKKVYFLPSGDHWKAQSGSRNMVANDKPMKQTIGVDRSAAIDAAKHEVKAVEQELSRNKTEEAAASKEEFDAKLAWNNAQKAHAKVTKSINQMQSTLDDLRAEAETSEEVPTIDTSDFETDVSEAEAALEDFKKNEAAIIEEIESLQPGIEELKNQLDEVAARNEKVSDDLEKVEAKLEDIVKGHARRQDAVEKMRAKVEQHEAALEQQEVLIRDEKEKVAQALRGAKVMHFKALLEKSKLEGDEDVDLEREPTEEDLAAIDIHEPSKDSKYYKTKLVSKQKKIESERTRRNMSEVDPAVARDKYLRAQKDLDSKMDQINTIEKNTDAMGRDLKERKKRWKQFRSHIAQMTNISFDEFLNKKGSAGEVEFDHDAGQLNLIVQKDNKDEHSQTKDVKALSGGERSFTTLALLLAIGESLETPFRVMDEFDVFLDPVARKLALTTLVRVAKEMEHRQFIFITPQDVSNLKTDPKLKIFSMKPPSRNAIVGGPQQQTLDFSG